MASKKKTNTLQYIYITKELYLIIIEEVQNQFDIDFTDRNPKIPPPQFKNNLSQFLTWLKDFIDERCKDFMAEIRTSFPTTRNIIGGKLKIKSSWAALMGRKKIHVLIHYANKNNKTFEDFLSDEKIFNTPRRQKIREEYYKELDPDEEQNASTVTFSLYTYHDVEDTKSHYSVTIKVNKGKNKKQKDNAVLKDLEDGKEYPGDATLQHGHLQISFPREEKENNLWMPLSLFFFLSNTLNLEEIPILIGTYAGISSLHKINPLAGEAILLNAKYKEENPEIELFISQRLHLNQHEISIDKHVIQRDLSVHGAEKILLPSLDKLRTLRSMRGKYEGFEISGHGLSSFITRFHFIIEEDFVIIDKSEDSYWGHMNFEAATLLIEFYYYKNKTNKRKRRIEQIDHYMVIGTQSTKNGFFKGSISGKGNHRDTFYSPIIINKVGELQPRKKYSHNEIDELLKCRPENKLLLEELVELEEERARYIQPFKDFLTPIILVFTAKRQHAVMTARHKDRLTSCHILLYLP